MKIAAWVVSIASFLLTGTAQANAEPYAKAAGWEITTEPGMNRCYMERFYLSKSGTTEGMIVVFDANEEQAILFWSTTSKIFPLAKGEMNFDIRFRIGETVDEHWGSQSFHYETVANAHIFRLAFLDRDSSKQIVADFGKYTEIGLFLGPVLQTAFPLTPAAVEKLTECAGRPL